MIKSHSILNLKLIIFICLLNFTIGKSQEKNNIQDLNKIIENSKKIDKRKLFEIDSISGKNGQIDHHFPEQIDHPFRCKLTTSFRFKLTT